MYDKFQNFLQNEISGIHDAGLYKKERIIITPQSASIKTDSTKGERSEEHTSELQSLE